MLHERDRVMSGLDKLLTIKYNIDREIDA